MEKGNTLIDNLNTVTKSPLSPKGKLIFWLIILFPTIDVSYLTLLILNLDNKGIDLASGVITSFIVAYALIDYSIARTDVIHYNDVLSKFFKELVENTERLTENSLKEQVSKIINEKIPDGNYPGFDKSPSFTNWSTTSDSENFFLKYLPSTEYYYFITQGFFNSSYGISINDSIKERIARIYAYQSKLNRVIQDFEEELIKEYVFLGDIRFQANQNISNTENQNLLMERYFERINTVFNNNPYFTDLKGFVNYSNDVIDGLDKQFPEIKHSEELEQKYQNIKKYLNKELK
jgi:hypothetical protein